MENSTEIDEWSVKFGRPRRNLTAKKYEIWRLNLKDDMSHQSFYNMIHEFFGYINFRKQGSDFCCICKNIKLLIRQCIVAFDH